MLLVGSIIKGLLQEGEIGEKQFQELIVKRIEVNENNAVSFLTPSKNLIFNTEFKIITQLKKDKQVLDFLL